MKKTLIILSCITCILALSPISAAGPLKEIIESRQYQSLAPKVRNPTQRMNTQKWRFKKNNFATIFNPSAGGWMNIVKWLDGPTNSSQSSDLKVHQADGDTLEKISGMQQLFELKKESAVIKLTVLVPTPEYREVAMLGLAQEFKSLTPPKESVEQTEEIQLSGAKGTLYYVQPKFLCVLVIPLKKQAVAQLITPSCKHKNELVDLAQDLDFRELNRKLAS